MYVALTYIMCMYVKQGWLKKKKKKILNVQPELSVINKNKTLLLNKIIEMTKYVYFKSPLK